MIQDTLLGRFVLCARNDAPQLMSFSAKSAPLVLP